MLERYLGKLGLAAALAAGAFAAPANADEPRSHEAICQGLEQKAIELIQLWPQDVEEITNDAFDEKLRRLRDRYDMIHYRLEDVRDEARREGCTGLPEAIESAFKQWDRP